MDPAAVRAFVSRDWARVAALKRERWRRRRRDEGPAANFELASELYHYIQKTRPAWPTAASRRADLEHHVELSRKLRAWRPRPAG